MNRNLLETLIGAALILTAVIGRPENAKRCADTGPPSMWVVKSPYPFQAGAERSFDELYHGPWRARIDIALYARPRSSRLVGTVKAGTVVKALLGETIVINPMRFVAARDVQVVTGLRGQKMQFATVHKGDGFWVLDHEDEGQFAIWWRCRVVGWDSTEPSQGNPNQLEQLGTNEERWVKVRDMKTGLSGWFNDDQSQVGQKLVPAQPTIKSTG